jgi:hypothetical protein
MHGATIKVMCTDIQFSSLLPSFLIDEPQNHFKAGFIRSQASHLNEHISRSASAEGVTRYIQVAVIRH